MEPCYPINLLMRTCRARKISIAGAVPLLSAIPQTRVWMPVLHNGAGNLSVSHTGSEGILTSRAVHFASLSGENCATPENDRTISITVSPKAGVAREMQLLTAPMTWKERDGIPLLAAGLQC